MRLLIAIALGASLLAPTSATADPLDCRRSGPLDIAFVIHGGTEASSSGNSYLRRTLLDSISLLTSRDRVAILDSEAGSPTLLSLAPAAFSGRLPASLRARNSSRLPLLFAGIARAAAELKPPTTARHQFILVIEDRSDPNTINTIPQLDALGQSLAQRGIVVAAQTSLGCKRTPLHELIQATGGFCVEVNSQLSAEIARLKSDCGGSAQ